MLPGLQDARVQRLHAAAVTVEQASAPAARRAVGAVPEETAARVAAGGAVARTAVGAGHGGSAVRRGGRDIAVAMEQAVLAAGRLGHGLRLVDGLGRWLTAAEEGHFGCGNVCSTVLMCCRSLVSKGWQIVRYIKRCASASV